MRGKKFRTSFADANVLWRVSRRIRTGVYECVVVNEPIKIRGKTYDSDFAGTTRIFAREEIEVALVREEWERGLQDAHEAYYESLKLGQIVHYHGGFGKFIRCEVVMSPAGKKCLRRLALVADWNSDELEGDSYQAQAIKKGKLFRPAASNIYENPKARSARSFGDPAKKPALKLKEGAA
jgi:hypothetical protein